MEKDDKPVPRVRFGDKRTDEEAGEHVNYSAYHRGLSRQSSVGSLSIHSAGGGTRTVQPEAALPITYRTLSIEIDEGQHQKLKNIKKAKEKAAVGMSRHQLLNANTTKAHYRSCRSRMAHARSA